jgi:2-polyprenyl-3-methyl-5-hydroxy-6-metoxy-1,4-benzoquinol methylase
MLPQTGERQIAETIEGIKANHRERYQFAYNKIKEEFGDTVDRPLRMLDCACGVGYGTMMLSQMGEHVDVLGLDIHPETIEVANRAYKTNTNQFAVCDLSDAESWESALAFSTVPFDAIVSIETIEHVQDAHALIDRYAQKTDFLIASVPNQNVVAFDKDLHPFHYRHYTRGEFSELLSDHGFIIDVWATQYNKIPGIVYEDADDGMGFIVSARKK